jgi:hypothetical protein
MRDTLFGDTTPWPPATVTAASLAAEPWRSFVRANELQEAGNREGAIEVLLRIAETPSLESRIQLQAWHLLRGLGVKPSAEIAKNVLGVVIEVGMPKGLDLLAAYADHHARYWNFSGAGIVWEHPNSSFDDLIDRVLAAGAAIAKRIGPWEEPRRPAPAKGVARLNMLTPSGLHFGEGPLEHLVKDPMASPLLTAGTQLMQALIKLANESKQSNAGPANPS